MATNPGINEATQPVIDPLKWEGLDYKRKGFYRAISEKADEHDNLSLLLAENNALHKHWLDRLAVTYQQKLDRTQLRISELKQSIRAERESANRLAMSRPEHQDRVKALEIELNQLDEQRKTLNDQFAKARQEEPQARLANLKKELDLIVENHSEVFNKKYAADTETAQEIAKQRTAITELQQGYRNTLQHVNNALRDLHGSGAGFPSARFLMGVGMGAAIAAGWFLSLFFMKLDHHYEQPLFFILSGLFCSIWDIIQWNPYGVGGGVLTTMGAWMVLLFVLSFAIYQIEHYVIKHGQGNVFNQVGLKFGQKDRTFASGFSGKTMFSLWLYLAPILLVLGIGFILLTIGKSEQEVRDLGRWTSSQFIGTTIALVMGGVIFLYIVKVIEPRRLLNTPGMTARKLLYSYFELFLVSGMSALVVIILLLVHYWDLGSAKESLSSLLGFLLTSSLCSVAIGYGLRQQSLIQSGRVLEACIEFLSEKLIAMATNKPYQAVLADRNSFIHKYLEVQTQAFDLLMQRLQETDQSEKQVMARVWRKGVHWVKRLFSRKAHNDHDGQAPPEVEFSEQEEHLFPNHKWNMEMLDQRVKEKRGELHASKENIRAIDDHTYTPMVNANNRAANLEEQVSKLHKEQDDIRHETIIALRNVRDHLHTSENDLREGYHLGRWYVGQRFERLSWPLEMPEPPSPPIALLH